MKILLEHKGILPVSKYGGTERQIYWIMRKLREYGHDVWLVSDPASIKVKEFGVHLIPHPGNNTWVKHIPSNIDIVHIFTKSDADLSSYPHVITIGGNGQIAEKFPLNTIFVSSSHAKNHGSTSYVDNGIDFSEYPLINKRPRGRSWDNILFLAKASWKVKNLKSCVRVCRQQKRHLHIIGGKTWSSMFSKYIHSHGFIDPQKKLEIMSKVDVLMFPVRWPEPFGISIIEAYAQGLPVIGSQYGSLPDLIESQEIKSGVIAKSDSELENALLMSKEELYQFDPEAIRENALKKYSLERMVDDYIDRYKQVVRGEKLNITAPTWKLADPPQTLMPF